MNFEGNLCFVVLAGKYRTGKSFLLNKILDIQGGEGVLKNHSNNIFFIV